MCLECLYFCIVERNICELAARNPLFGFGQAVVGTVSIEEKNIHFYIL